MSEQKRKSKSVVSESADEGRKKRKSKSVVSENVDEGKKKKKNKSEASDATDEEKKKKKKKSVASESADEGKKKKKKSVASESEGKKKKKKSDSISEGGGKKKKKDRSEKSGDADEHNIIDDILNQEDKEAKIKKLEEEVETLKALLKKHKDFDTINLPAAAKLQAENDYLEAQIRDLMNKYERIEDKLDIIKRAHKNATNALKNAHTQAMDQEELEYIRMQLENKRNELAEARNLIKELQKVGWSMLPPKVADESKKTEKELETVAKEVEKAEKERNVLYTDNENIKAELERVKVKYREAKEKTKAQEDILDEVTAEFSQIQKEIETKAEEAKEMELALKGAKQHIEATGGVMPNMGAPEPPPKPEIDPEELARQEEKKRKKEEKKAKKLAEKNEFKTKYDDLREEVNKKEEELRQINKDVKELQRIAKEGSADKNALKKLETERDAVTKEVAAVKKSFNKEVVMRKMYYNIIEDMLGKVKVFCRVREDKSGKEGIQITDEYSLKVLGSKPQEFQFDKVFSSKDELKSVFDSVSYLFDQANDGFNCCAFLYGEAGSGKTYTSVGSADEGIMKRASTKIGDILKKNKKNQLQQRIFVYMIELYQDKIYDLLKNEMTGKMQIRRDCYGMVVISHAEYKECITDADVKSTFNTGINNRGQAFSKLGCKETESHFVFGIAIEVGNKFHQKFTKGKVTMIKLAGSEKLGGSGGMNSSLAALGDVIAALTTEKPFIPYKNDKLTMLMQDALGGGAKTVMIACVSPLEKNVTESINTLTYASRVKLVKNDAQKNIDSVDVYKLKNNIERLVRGFKTETIALII